MASRVSLPLRDYIEHVHAELQSEMDRRYAAQQHAAEAADRALSARLDHMNEFRRTLSDQAAQFATRHEITAMTDRIAALEIRVTTATEIVNRRRLDIGAIMQLVSVVVAIAAVLVVAFHP